MTFSGSCCGRAQRLPGASWPAAPARTSYATALSPQGAPHCLFIHPHNLSSAPHCPLAILSRSHNGITPHAILGDSLFSPGVMPLTLVQVALFLFSAKSSSALCTSRPNHRCPEEHLSCLQFRDMIHKATSQQPSCIDSLTFHKLNCSANKYWVLSVHQHCSSCWYLCTGFHMVTFIIPLGQIAKGVISSSCGNVWLTFQKQADFQSICTLLHSHQQCMPESVFPHPC